MWFGGLDSVHQGVSASDSSPPVRGFSSLALTSKRKGCYGGCSLADQQQGWLCHVVGPLGSPIPLNGKLAASRLLRQEQSLSCRTGFEQTSAKKEALFKHTSTLFLERPHLELYLSHNCARAQKSFQERRYIFCFLTDLHK